MGRKVIFYETSAGKCPIRDFLEFLPAKVARKVTWVLNLIEDLEVVPSSYFKKLVATQEIWECRITVGSSAYRVFCFFVGDSTVVLTHGFLKKSQKTPRAEIEKAEVYRRDFFIERSKKDE